MNAQSRLVSSSSQRGLLQNRVDAREGGIDQEKRAETNAASKLSSRTECRGQSFGSHGNHAFGSRPDLLLLDADTTHSKYLAGG